MMPAAARRLAAGSSGSPNPASGAHGEFLDTHTFLARPATPLCSPFPATCSSGLCGPKALGRCHVTACLAPLSGSDISLSEGPHLWDRPQTLSPCCALGAEITVPSVAIFSRRPQRGVSEVEGRGELTICMLCFSVMDRSPIMSLLRVCALRCGACWTLLNAPLSHGQTGFMALHRPLGQNAGLSRLCFARWAGDSLRVASFETSTP
mmetsp:Transcript_87405/g.127834  ORF Transcript_87405/g.127834 Transcript_87405/m.127834 type:complete len:207 (-) Transcript_87405:798-1418(-)